MKVKELIEKLQKADPELEIYFYAGHATGNIKTADFIEKSTYGFFGKAIPCLIIGRYENDDIDDHGEEIKRKEEL